MSPTRDHKPVPEVAEVAVVVKAEEEAVKVEAVKVEAAVEDPEKTDHKLEEAEEAQEVEEVRTVAEAEVPLKEKEEEVEEPTPKETQSDKETREKEETDTRVTKVKSTLVWTEETVPEEAEEEPPREVQAASSMRELDQRANTRRETSLAPSLRKPPLRPEKKRRSPSHNTKKSSMVSHGMTTSPRTQPPEPSRLEPLLVSPRMSRPKLTPLSRSTSKPPSWLTRPLTLLPEEVPSLLMPDLPSVSPQRRPQLTLRENPEVEEVAEEEVAVEVVTESPNRETKDKMLDMHSRRLTMNSHLYEQYEFLILSKE